MRALAPTRTAAPAESILTIAEARAHLRVTSSDEDTYITSLIAAAEAYLDGYSGVLGRALVTQTWAQSFSDFPSCDEIRLPLGQIQSVSSITYYDEANSSQTLAASDYSVVTDGGGPKIVLAADASWPGTYDRPDAVTVTWVCGYGDAADIPEAIIHAAKLLIGQWFDRREVEGDPGEASFAVSALLKPFRKVGL